MTNNILNKLLNYKNWTFKLNWSSGVTLISLIIGCVYLYYENKSLKVKLEKLPLMEQTINTLNNTVSGLKSSNETFNNVIQSFMLNPPTSLQKDIDRLKLINNFYHPNNSLINDNQSDSLKFVGNRPPSF